MIDSFPPVQELLDMDPEQIGEYILLYLNRRVDAGTKNLFYKTEITNPDGGFFMAYAGELAASQRSVLQRILAEAWGWLIAQGFLARDPEQDNAFWFITRRGHEVRTAEDFVRFRHLRLLPKDALDPTLARRVWPSFLNADFDTAVFAAFKEVEVRMRGATGLPTTLLGSALARKAFDPDNGVLTDSATPDRGEREAYSHLFAGTLGAFKNPSSHRDVDYDDPNVAASLILFANTLLGIIDRRAASKTQEPAE